MSATLGGLIKDYRLQKNLSQMEVSFSLGWKEPSRLSRIEQGRVGSPSRKLIDRIVKALKLSEEEKNHLLLAGNYLPTEEEIEKIREETNEMIQKWPHPSILYDFAGRVINCNKKTTEVYKVDKKSEREIINKHIWLAEVIFDPDFSQNKDLKGEDVKIWREYLLGFVFRYQRAQRTRTKQKWYIDLMKRLMSVPLFREIWKEVQNSKIRKEVINFDMVRSIVDPSDSSKRLSFYFTIVPLIKDPRFEVEFEIPADQHTFAYFQKRH